MKILIATDGSPCSQIAVRSAAERVWPPDSELRALTVKESPAFYGSVMILSHLAAEGREEAERIATEAAAVLGSKGNKVSHIVREGFAAKEILVEAAQWGADMILVGTHGRQGESLFLLGSVAERVMTYAPCSVEIVREPSKKEVTVKMHNPILTTT